MSRTALLGRWLVDPLPEDVDACDVILDDPPSLEDNESDTMLDFVISHLEQINADTLPDIISHLEQIKADTLPDAAPFLTEVDSHETLGIIASDLDYPKQGIDGPIRSEPAEEGIQVTLNGPRVAEEKYHSPRYHIHMRTFDEQGKAYQ